jgi:phage-related tail fiber protein
MAIQGIKITDLPESVDIPTDAYVLLTKSNNISNKLSTSSFYRSFSGLKSASNLSNGIGIFKNISSNTLFFNTLTAKEGIDISLQSNLVTLNVKDNSVVINKLEPSIRTLLASLSTRMTAAENSLLAVNPQALIGAVLPFVTQTAPIGWLICNGDVIGITGSVQGIPVSNLQNLRNLLGSKFGAMGKLPDLRGEFIRGWDGGRGIDGGRSMGTLQLDSIQNIAGSFGLDDASTNVPFTGPFYNIGRTSNTGAAAANKKGAIGIRAGFDSSRTVRSSTETRPRNVSLLYCVKY